MKNHPTLAKRFHPWNMGVATNSLIQCLPRFSLLPIIKACIIWEDIQSIESLRIHWTNNNVWVHIEVVLHLWFHEREGEKGCLSSIDLNTCVVAISISLKNSRNECIKMQEASKACWNQEKWSTWNGASIVVATLDFIIITYIRLHI